MVFGGGAVAVNSGCGGQQTAVVGAGAVGMSAAHFYGKGSWEDYMGSPKNFRVYGTVEALFLGIWDIFEML